MKKVAILTLNGYMNYGNRLQKYALTKVLHDMDNKVYSIWKKDLVGKSKEFIVSCAVFMKKYDKLRKFHKVSKAYSKDISIDDIKRAGIDTVVIGSDQVWNPEYYERDHSLMYKSQNGERVISYAASVGRPTIPEEYADLYRSVISDYDAISVREKEAEAEIKRITGREDVVTVLDPTLLLAREEWEKIETRPAILGQDSKYVFCCFLGEMPAEERKDIEEYAQKNECFIINILDPNDPYNKISGPQDFLCLIHHAQLVCTDSFHASVFSFLFNRPLIVFKRKGHSDYMYSRIQNLIDTFKLKNREYKGTITQEQIDHDYSEGYQIREKEVQKSMDFLYRGIYGKSAIEIAHRADCCGCGACSEVCPKKCIRMKEDREGFLYPSVDRAKCIDCGQCRHVCPIINSKWEEETAAREAEGKEQSTKPDTWIAYVKDEDIRLNSSSGGIFSALAAEVIGNGGVVFGAEFDDDFMVHHVKAETAEELAKLRGSKYIQSRTENTFRKAKEALDAGRPVLYSGTGCQIAGLKAFLKKDYDNLLAVDVICHGVPSLLVWKKYLAELEKKYGASVSNINFRNKDTGWKKYSITIDFTNGKKYVSAFNLDSFMKLFLHNICLRPSCHSCKYKPIHSKADITIGDCWGIENYMPEIDDDKGISVVYIHTPKGAEYIDKIKNSIFIKKAEFDKASQPMVYCSSLPHMRRKQLFAKLEKGDGIDELVKLVPISTVDRVIWKAKRMLEKDS